VSRSATPQAEAQTQAEADTRPTASSHPESKSESKSESQAEPEPDPADPIADPQQAWAAVLELARKKVSMTSWVSALELVSIDAGTVTVRLQTGHSQVRGFLTASRLGQLGDLMRPILGRSVHVKLDAMAGPTADRQASSGQRSNRNQSVDIEAAMQMPLVRELVDEFKGDASIVGLEDDPDAADESKQQDASTQEQKD